NYWWETQYCEQFCILLTNEKDILSCQDKNKENRLYGPPRLSRNEKYNGGTHKKLMGPVIFGISSVETKEEIKKLAYYAIESEDKSLLCKPAFILFFKYRKLKSRPLDISAIFDYFSSPRKGVLRQNEFRKQVEEFHLQFSSEVNNNPCLGKYLGIQWLLNARGCFRYLLNEFHGRVGRDFRFSHLTPPDEAYPRPFSLMVDLLINDSLDCKVLMKELEEIKIEELIEGNRFYPYATTEKNYNMIEACFNEVINAKGLLGRSEAN
ncbi:MAG: hypothetical protein AAF335_04985, partial [Bacteroidota bacterium]